MREELEQKLSAEFPFMRRDPAALGQNFLQDLYGAFGCECGDGWYSLLRSMCAEISELYACLGVEVDFKPEQIKEKYGMLRVYFIAQSCRYDEIRLIVEKYATLSETVCEECGKSGILRNDLSWIATLCDTHYLMRKQQVRGCSIW